jgi:Uma2 family endonuclease
MSTTTPLMRAEELERLPDHGALRELVHGEIVEMSPAGPDHGEVCAAVVEYLRHFIRTQRLGKTYGPETGFLLQEAPDTVLAPDFAFIRRERIASLNRERAFLKGAPDLVVEVLSPSDTMKSTTEKAVRWLGFGTQQVWIVSPRHRTVTILDSPQAAGKVLSESAVIENILILPGFRLAVADLFETLDETD